MVLLMLATVQVIQYMNFCKQTKMALLYSRTGQLVFRHYNKVNLYCNKFQTRVISLKHVPESPTSTGEDFEQKNIRLKRPTSPHLSIYAPQLTWLLSITHRATGLAMGGLLMSYGIGAWVFDKNYPEYLEVVQNMNLSPTTIIVLKTLVAFPFCYHYCNGVRHLCWDFGKFLTLKGVYTSGYVMLLSSFVMTGLLVFCL